MSNKFETHPAQRGGGARRGAGRVSSSVAQLAAILLLGPLGACGTNKALAPPEVAYDYHNRHPVVLADAPYTVDLFPTLDGRLDAETVGRLREFMAHYRRFGRGQITVLAPRGATTRSTQVGLSEIRRALAAFGAGPSIYIGSYPVADPNLAAPIRITFNGMKAKVAGPCGEWPDDLASGNSFDGWQNRSFYNFGCANQATFAAQLDDPRDMADARGETPPDVEQRMRATGKLRTGTDPSTAWATKSASISSVGGN